MSYPHTNQRRSLGDIARGGVDNLQRAWDSTQAAAGVDPVPSGTYRCLVSEGRLFASQSNGTPGYKLVLQVLDGPHAGRRLWHDVWLTDAALSRAKYELGQLGITDLGQLEQPLPAGLIVEVVVSLRTGDDGLQYNKVRSFRVIPPVVPVDDFAPSPESGQTSTPGSSSDGTMTP
jgi:hypothetical protein